MPPILEPNHPMHMQIFGRRAPAWRTRICWQLILTLCLSLLLPLPVLGQILPAAQSPVDPLPQDTGTLGLKQMLLRLQTTARQPRKRHDFHP